MQLKGDVAHDWPKPLQLAWLYVTHLQIGLKLWEPPSWGLLKVTYSVWLGPTENVTTT